MFGIFASFAFALITGITTTASAASVDVNAFVNLTITPTNKETKYVPIDVELYEATNGGSLGINKAGTPSYTGQAQGDTAEANSTVAKLGGNTAFTGVADGTYVLCVKGSAEICSNLVTIDENTENPLGIQVDVKDPATSAQFEEGFYEQLQAQQAQQGTTNTCGGMVSGMGWIICPVINGITMLNDFMWGLATILLKVNPLMQSDPVYEAWGIIRNIANVAFVISFLIIIFSQLTGAGISNYGVKKLLPRLLICAVLVNISFVLMQLAVDVANILGAGLFDLLTSITPNVQGATWGMLFKNIVGLGSVGALSALGVTLAGGPAAALWMLGPIVIMGALGFLAALLTLIFRQAVIPVLAVMAPLAFVAYLLPNTESWFKKWSSLFMSMLMLYPIAGIVFGGARFVSAVVMGDNSEWFKHMIGLIILTLPLFSLPYLASKGGALMSAVGGKLNGLAEKARNPVNNWAKGHEDEARAQYLATDGAFGARNRLGRYMQGHARNFAARRKTREANTKTYGTQFQNRWANTDHGMGAIDLGREADDILAETMEKAGNRYITSAAGIAATDALAIEKKRTTRNTADAAHRQDTSAIGKMLDDQIAETKLQAGIDTEATNTRVANSTTGQRLHQQYNEAKKISEIDNRRLGTAFSRSATGMQLEDELGVANIEAKTVAADASTRLETDAGTLDVRLAEKAANAKLKAATDITARIATEATAGTVGERIARLTSEGVSAAAAAQLADDFYDAQRSIDITADQTSSAQRIQREEYQTELKNDVALARTAGGIDIEHGALRKQAGAVLSMEKTRSENISANRSLFKDQRTSTNDLISTARDESADIERRLAAAELVMETGTPDEMMEIIDFAAQHPVDQAGITTEVAENNRLFQQTIGDQLVKRKFTATAGKDIGDLKQGILKTTDPAKSKRTEMIEAVIKSKKFSPSTFPNIHVKELQEWIKVLEDPTSNITDEEKFQLGLSIQAAYDDPRIGGNIDGDQRDELNKILAIASRP